jgi:cyanophycinase-like exopeptidase
MATNGTTNGTDNGVAKPVDISVALAPNDIGSIPALLKDITAGVELLSTGGDQARYDLILKTRTMMQALETPRETMIKHTWAQTGAIAGLSLGVETGLWKLMAENGDKPQKVTDLAESIKVDPVLLGMF